MSTQSEDSFRGHLESSWNIIDNFFDIFRSCLTNSESFRKIECQVVELIFRLNPGGHPKYNPKGRDFNYWCHEILHLEKNGPNFRYGI